MCNRGYCKTRAKEIKYITEVVAERVTFLSSGNKDKVKENVKSQK